MTTIFRSREPSRIPIVRIIRLAAPHHQLDALRYVRSENANRMNIYVAVGGIFELDMTHAGIPDQKSSSELQSARKVA